MKTIKPSEINPTIAGLLPDHQGYVLGGDRDWYPIDFEHDPRGTVMLEENLLTSSYTIWMANLPKGRTLLIGSVDGKMSPIESTNIARAFLRAHDITVEEAEEKR